MNSDFIQLIDTLLKHHSQFSQHWMDELSITPCSRLTKVGILLVNAQKCSLYRDSPAKADVRYELLQELLGTCAIHYLCQLDWDYYYLIPKTEKERYVETKNQLELNYQQLKKFDIWKDFVEWAVGHDLTQMINATEEVFSKLNLLQN